MASEVSLAGAEQDLRRRVEELERELSDAHRREEASADVLKIISRSTFDLQAVLDALVESATRLCDADHAWLFRREGDHFRWVTSFGHATDMRARLREFFRPLQVQVDRGSVTGRAALEAKVIHVPDVLADAEYTWGRAQEIGGYRAALGAPLIHKGNVVGVIFVAKTLAQPFTAKQIELVENFADQAVIAIENTRLFEDVQARTRELSELLDCQTATGEVLRVISSSPTDVQPVFEAIVGNASQLCDAEFSAVARFENGLLHLAAMKDLSSDEMEAFHSLFPRPPARNFVMGRAFVDACPVHSEDVLAEIDYDARTRELLQRKLKYRTFMAIPILREGVPIGVIGCARREVKPFTPAQIALVATFANQAVIAIENTRLFEEVQARTSELTESLRQQTATADVLKVISRSAFDLKAVLSTLVHSAASLCEAENVQIFLRDGEVYRLDAYNGFSPEYQDYVKQNPITPGRGTLVARTALHVAPVHIPDALADPEYTWREGQRLAGFRAMLGVPLVRKGICVGVMAMTRTAPRPFTTKQIELVENFADQAAIAIENTRLFDELTESLERQTATGEILGVISSSPTDVQPVFDTIARNAVTLCAAAYAMVFRFDGTLMHLSAHHNVPPEGLEALKQQWPMQLDHRSVPARAVLERRVVHVHDVLTEADNPYLSTSSALGIRTMLIVPMLREGHPIGAVAVYRQEVEPFSEQQIALVATFAGQAVIAIENTRLFTELTETLDYQTATSEVLGVISRSPTEVQPVFDMIAQGAARLCKAQFCFVYRFDGALLHFVAHHGITAEGADIVRRSFPSPPGRGSAAARAVLHGRVAQVPDITADPDFALGAAANIAGYRSAIGVPMLLRGVSIGSIAVARAQVGLLPDRQIELLQTFADQAVIAVEIARLFEEVQARTRELTRSVAELRSLGEVGQAVNSSLELNVVLPRILEHACSMSDTSGGAVYVFDRARGQFDLAAGHNMSEELIEAVREHPIRLGESSVGQCAERREAVQLVNLAEAPPHPLYKMHIESGMRALLAVPLLHLDEVIGALVLRRRTPGEFPAAVVELMQTFANQSAIAIQNARLFREIAQKSRELEIASQHKSQFVANMSHELRTPLAAILGYAELMQEGFYGALSEKSTDALTRIRSNGKHLLGLINAVLDIAKIESGQFSLNLNEYALESVVETVRAATESLAATKKLALKTNVAKRLPIGLGDEQRLTQVLLNLVGNAIKFTDTGEVLITATAVNGHFTVGVADTGPGIPPEELKRVFEQFHQIDNSNTKAKGGTGLGLAIAKEIVEMHGGRLWAESMLGKGATFLMELPIRAQSRNGAV